MSNVQFDEQNLGFKYKSREVFGNPVNPKIIQFLINNKIVKDEKTAANLILILTAVIFLVSIFIFVTFGVNRTKINPEELKTFRAAYPITTPPQN